MTEQMGVRVELWILAADEAGLWLVNGNDAWRSDPIPADSKPQAEVELLSYDHAPDLTLSVIHSTSWRYEDPHIILTFVGIAQAGEFAAADWPDAKPITPQLVDDAGKPLPHVPDGEPVPRPIDVLMHGVRHLAYLRETDEATSAAMGGHWQDRLREFEPALSGMYRAA
jgi:hypothetical protein